MGVLGTRNGREKHRRSNAKVEVGRRSPLPSGGGGWGAPLHVSSLPQKRENGTRNGIPGVTPPNSIFKGVGMEEGLPFHKSGMLGADVPVDVADGDHPSRKFFTFTPIPYGRLNFFRWDGRSSICRSHHKDTKTCFVPFLFHGKVAFGCRQTNTKKQTKKRFVQSSPLTMPDRTSKPHTLTAHERDVVSATWSLQIK